MKKNRNRFFSSVIAVALSLAMAFSVGSVRPMTAYAAEDDSVSETATNEKHVLQGSFDEMDAPSEASSEPNQLPLTGYYSKSITVGEVERTAKIYIAEGTKIRPYFTVIAVPDGVDTAAFLEDNGWFNIADANQEGLFILEPGEEGWGSAEEEAEYVNSAMSFYSSNKYFSVYGENYLVGYGLGGSALERWAASNPLKVISQVYVDSNGLDGDYLAEVGETVFPTQNGSYSKINFPEDFTLLKYNDTVIPTWYVGGEPTDSLAYWMACNDCQDQAVENVYGSVYQQKENSTRWMTDYAGDISKVAVADTREINADLTADICDFMYYYTRYENSFAYSNGLYVRRFYSDDNYRTILVDGVKREYMVYEPENMQANAPVMVVFPGNTQTDLNFIDATQWQNVADKEGFLLVILCETYNTATTVTFKNPAPFYEAVLEAIKEEYAGRIDTGRVYANGQSMGGMYAQGFGSTNPEYFAAVASTSGCLMDAMTGDTSGRTYLTIPCMMIYGMGDNVNFSGNLWDDTENQLDDWAAYYTEANGVSLSDVAYEDGVVTSVDRNNHRTQTTWTWTKEVDGVEVPIFQVGQNSARAHNCLPVEEEILYEYASHFSVEYDAAGNVVARYYSPSAFKTAGDEVTIYEVQQKQTITTSFTKKTVAYKAGATYKLGAKNTGDSKLTYKSSNAKVATVSTKGKVTIKGTGKATITITAAETAKFTKATKKVTITVVPAKATISKVASNKKAQLTVTVKKDSKATGYQIQVSTSKKFTKATTATLTKNSKTFTKLTAGKKYYVRARAYKTISGKKCYGAYSAVKSVKVKK